eukprot:1593238-Pleurochrysis_carterae.AAC.1
MEKGASSFFLSVSVSASAFLGAGRCVPVSISGLSLRPSSTPCPRICAGLHPSLTPLALCAHGIARVFIFSSSGSSLYAGVCVPFREAEGRMDGWMDVWREKGVGDEKEAERASARENT